MINLGGFNFKTRLRDRQSLTAESSPPLSSAFTSSTTTSSPPMLIRRSTMTLPRSASVRSRSNLISKWRNRNQRNRSSFGDSDEEIDFDKQVVPMSAIDATTGASLESVEVLNLRFNHSEEAIVVTPEAKPKSGGDMGLKRSIGDLKRSSSLSILTLRSFKKSSKRTSVASNLLSQCEIRITDSSIVMSEGKRCPQTTLISNEMHNVRPPVRSQADILSPSPTPTNDVASKLNSDPAFHSSTNQPKQSLLERRDRMTLRIPSIELDYFSDLTVAMQRMLLQEAPLEPAHPRTTATTQSLNASMEFDRSICRTGASVTSNIGLSLMNCIQCEPQSVECGKFEYVGCGGIPQVPLVSSLSPQTSHSKNPLASTMITAAEVAEKVIPTMEGTFEVSAKNCSPLAVPHGMRISPASLRTSVSPSLSPPLPSTLPSPCLELPPQHVRNSNYTPTISAGANETKLSNSTSLTSCSNVVHRDTSLMTKDAKFNSTPFLEDDEPNDSNDFSSPIIGFPHRYEEVGGWTPNCGDGDDYDNNQKGNAQKTTDPGKDRVILQHVSSPSDVSFHTAETMNSFSYSMNSETINDNSFDLLKQETKPSSDTQTVNETLESTLELSMLTTCSATSEMSSPYYGSEHHPEDEIMASTEPLFPHLRIQSPHDVSDSVSTATDAPVQEEEQVHSYIAQSPKKGVRFNDVLDVNNAVDKTHGRKHDEMDNSHDNSSSNVIEVEEDEYSLLDITTMGSSMGSRFDYEEDDDDDDDESSAESEQYMEFIRHRKERRLDDCSMAEETGCSEYYAEYQKQNWKRKQDRKDALDEFSMQEELGALFSDCTYMFQFINEQFIAAPSEQSVNVRHRRRKST